VIEGTKNMKKSAKIKSSYIIYTDGGSRGNPGQAAYGFIVYDHENTVIFEQGKRLGIATNNVAEYMGILSALEWVVENSGNDLQELSFFMDSQLAVMQLSGIYKIKNPTLYSLAKKIEGITRALPCPTTYTHVRRENNKEADRLVNEALDTHALA